MPKGSNESIHVSVLREETDSVEDMIKVGIDPGVRVVEGELPSNELDLLRRWIEINREVIESYWNGAIPSTMDAINALKPLSP